MTHIDLNCFSNVKLTSISVVDRQSHPAMKAMVKTARTPVLLNDTLNGIITAAVPVAKVINSRSVVWSRFLTNGNTRIM